MITPSNAELLPVNALALIPAYNEGSRVAAVVRAALQVLPVLVVDDGSSDDTAAQAQAAGAEVVFQRPNQGKGAALLTGLRLALERGYDAILTLDADGQHDPAEIPAFLAAYTERGGDLIIGQRNFNDMPAVRRASNTLGTRLFSWALGQPVPDNQSGYRLLSRRLASALLASGQVKERGFEFEVEMIVTCVQLGYQLDWVPIRTIYAGEKSHISPLRHVLKFVQVSLRARQQMRSLNRVK